MQAERSTWSDERLDDLVAQQKDFRRDVDRRFDKIDERLDSVGVRIEQRLDKLFYLQISVTAAVIAAVAAITGIQS